MAAQSPKATMAPKNAAGFIAEDLRGSGRFLLLWRRLHIGGFGKEDFEIDGLAQRASDG